MRTKAIGGNVEAAHLAGVCSVVGGWKRGKWSVQEVRRLKRNVKAFMKVRPHHPHVVAILMELSAVCAGVQREGLGCFHL